MSELTQNISETILACIGIVTALRSFVILLQKFAVGTPTEDDDEALGAVAKFLGRVDRALDWVSVGPTSRKR